MVYRIAVVQMTLSDLQGHSYTSSLFKCDLPYSCAAINKLSTEIVRHSVMAEILVEYTQQTTLASSTNHCMSAH